MREIKFRGKDDSGNWLIGNYVRYHEDDGEELTCIVGDKRNNVDACLVFTPVSPTTIGQFTGLIDKNGKEIYEGDIVLMENVYRYGSCRGVVKWDDGGGWFTDYAGDYDHRIHGASGFVIGNIHDNPELLEGGAK